MKSKRSKRKRFKIKIELSYGDQTEIRVAALRRCDGCVVRRRHGYYLCASVLGRDAAGSAKRTGRYEMEARTKRSAI